MMSIRQQLVVVGFLWICIVFIMFLFAMVTGNFRIDNSNHNKWFGVYDRKVDRAAQYNTGFETAVMFEGFSLLILPLFLLLCRKLGGFPGGLPVVPWFVLSSAVLFSALIWPLGIGARTRPLDPFTMSELPDLLLFQIPLAVGFAGTLYLLMKISSKATRLSGKIGVNRTQEGGRLNDLK